MSYARGLVAAAALLAIPHPAIASSCIPGFDFAAFGKNSVTFTGNGHTDSYDDQVLPVPTTHNSGAGVCTDGTANGAITLTGNATINGGACVGVGGTGGSPTISTSGGATYQSGYAQTSNQTMTSVTVPSVGTNQGSHSGTGTLAANETYGSVSCSGGPGSTLTLNTGTYVMSSLTLSGQCSLVVGSGPIVVYITASLDLSGGSVTNSTYKATNLIFLVAATATSVKVTGGSSASFGVYAPDTDVQITGGADIYGAVVGKTVTDSGNGTIHYDTELSNATAGNLTCAAIEISRASPVIATITCTGGSCGSTASGVYTASVQGTYNSISGSATTLSNAASISTWTFPWITGHMRARVASTTTSASYSSGTLLFDAASGIPTTITTCSAPFTGSCRAIFTNTNATAATGITSGTANIGQTVLDYTSSSSSSTIGATIVTGLTTANYQSIIQKIQRASLGGVDRSTVAVIGPSTYAGSAQRPTVAYFGATDGMLHAVCAGTGTSPSSACTTYGTELWAFLPRVDLPLVGTNLSRIDGSVRVVDLYDDWAGTGTKSWKTMLYFQTGYAVGATGAFYGIDVTDPTNPSVLWEVTAPGTAPGTLDIGAGLTIAAGPVLINGVSKNVVVAETNNGGSASSTTSGIVVAGVYANTGAKAWTSSFTYQYPSPPRSVSADAALLPLTGIPGGAVGADLTGNGFFTDFVLGDLYGNLWRLKASDGTSQNGTGVPLFQYGSNKHPLGAPPAIYNDGTAQYALFATGGYDDPYSTLWTTTSNKILSVKLSYTGASLTDVSTGTNVPINVAFSGAASADKNYAQATIIGGQAFIVSDSSDVNLSSFGTSGSTGHVTTVSLGTSATTVVAMSGVANGAGSVINDPGSTSIYGAYALTTRDGSSGMSVDLTSTTKLTRNLWLRSM